jgi:hypothetical protein
VYTCGVRKLLQQATRVVVLSVLAAGTFGVVLAWTGPSAAAPANNVSAPIHAGATGQTKSGFLGLNGATASYAITVNGTASGWTGVFNWPPASAPASSYGILVGSSAGGYSQFQNNAGYYSLLAYSSYGLYTNGTIYAGAGISGPGGFGGGFQLTSGGGCYVGNTATGGGCSCPGYAPNARWAYYMDTNSTYGGGRGYLCEGM